MASSIDLTSEQKTELTKKVGHDLNVKNDHLGNVGSFVLKLTPEQQAKVETDLGKKISEIDLTEQDLKKFSSIACYEKGGIVAT